MTINCRRCAAPLSSTDAGCPGCGEAARPVPAASEQRTGRRVLLEAPEIEPPVSGPHAAHRRRSARSAGGNGKPRARMPIRSPRPPGGPAVSGAVTTVPTSGYRPVRSPGRNPLTWVAALLSGTAATLLTTAVGPAHSLELAVAAWPVTALVLLVGIACVLLPRVGPPGHVGTRFRIDIHRFTVTDAAGRTIRCELMGRVAGALPARGDIVEVYGRLTDGVVQAYDVVRTVDQTSVRTSTSWLPLLARTLPVAAIGLAAVVAFDVGVILIQR